MPKTTLYFKHEMEERGDKRFVKMFNEWGTWEAYGIYWCIIEILSKQDGHVFRLSEINLMSNMMRDVPPVKIEMIVRKYGLFVVDETEDMFYSSDLIERMEKFHSKSAQATAAVNSRWEKERKAKEEEEKNKQSKLPVIYIPGVPPPPKQEETTASSISC